MGFFGEKKSRFSDEEILYRSLYGKTVLVMQGEGGESTDYFQGRVLKALPPKGGANFWTLRLEGVTEVIAVDPRITCVTVLGEKDN